MQSTGKSDFEIFSFARKIPAGEQRRSFLDQACSSDSQLRESVEALLAAHQPNDGFLEGQALVFSDLADADCRDDLGSRIGPYTLLEVIGEGGMGTVYLAEQSEPVHRRVALKLIKRGLETKQVIARFEAERQALALMSHPNIAKILDGGETESGRPYFVMELVAGKPITDFCEEHELDQNSRLNLFQQVCHAVQHAHQKGIIHRDLKPNNVLVSTCDDQLMPKIIDFGVAKATTQPLTEKTMFTRFNQIVGTLEYMSPEQATFNNVDIDIRTDVYSLGAILYELLAGMPPFSKEQIASQPLDETLKMIREAEPTRPSTRRRATAQQTLTDADRQNIPKGLSRTKRNDLDRIAMKCLEKDRNCRYETVMALTDDIRRYKVGLPVTAVPSTFRYQFWKFVRRHPTIFATSGIVVVALLAMVIVLVDSNRRLSLRDRDLQAALRQSQENERRASENFLIARQVVDEYLTRVSNEMLAGIPGGQPLRRDLLRLAQKFYLSLLSQADDEHSSQRDLATAAEQVGRIHWRLGESDEAIGAFQQAIDIREELYRQRLTDPDRQFDLASTYNSMAGVYLNTGDLELAKLEIERANKLAVDLIERIPNEARVARLLAKINRNRADLFSIAEDWNSALFNYDEAIRLLRELAETDSAGVDDIDSLAVCYNSRGIALKHSDQIDLAMMSYEEATKIRRRLVDLDPVDPERKFSLSGSLHNLAILIEKSGDLVRAEEVFLQAIEIAREVVTLNQHVPKYRVRLARHLKVYAGLLEERGLYEGAWEFFTEALSLQERLVNEDPMPSRLVTLIHIHNRMSVLAGQLKDETSQLSHQRAGFDLAVQLVEDHKDKFGGLRELEQAKDRLIELLRDRNQVSEIRMIEQRTADLIQVLRLEKESNR